jgi:hypothetical protein
MRRAIPWAAACLLWALPIRAADDAAVRIVGAALTQGGAASFLERLTDRVGGRVTGSPEMATAVALVRTALRDAGLEDVRAESWPLETRWSRGSAAARILAPVERPLLVGSFGWAPGTGGTVEAPVVDVGSVDGVDRLPAADAVRGRAVIVQFEAKGPDQVYVVRARAVRALAAAGAAAVLVPAGKAGRLLDIGCFGNYPRAPLPMLSLAEEDTRLLRRLLAQGPVRVALAVTNTLEAGPFPEVNVLADLRGRERPEEVVLMGAHLDSWETGQGAIDNGAGVAAVLEAARILRSLGARPRRTVRFALWSGEEQALLGSRAYVETHRAELPRLRAYLNMDHGPQAPRGFILQGRTDLVAPARRLLAPLAGLGAAAVSEDVSFSTDHAYFAAAGVPTFNLDVDPGEYDTHHHAISDTLDKVDLRQLALDTAAMALLAWTIAESDEPLPHLSAADAATQLERTGMASTYRLLKGEQP